MIQILLVDDEENSLKGMQQIIPWTQWQCEIAGVADSGKKALEIINSRHIDIVFTDIKMPEMDGLQLINEIQKTHRDISFVIISGYGEFEYAQKAIKYGVKNYLLKPVGRAEIEETILSLTDGFQKNSEQAAVIDIPLEPIIKEIVVSVTQKNWNRISEILLGVFKDINSRGGDLEQCRKLAIRLLSSLIKNEVIYSSESTLLLAGQIGSADRQSTIYGILKDQIMITQNQKTGSGSRKMNPHIQKILIYLLTHYKDKNLTLKWLSENITYVKSDYLGKLFLSETGKNFSAYLNEYRITRASELLRNDSQIPIGDLAFMVGYHDNVSYFIRQFKKISGMTPAEFAASSVVKT